MAIHQTENRDASRARPLKRGLEALAALAGTLVAVILLVITAMNSGPLWRDEVNTINMAQMASLRELWNNMPFESFPLLWTLILRGCDFLGLANSDAEIRGLGLLTGLFFLASLWLCSRWIGGRAPTISIALLGSLPAFLFIIGANRAYGLASGLLVLCFGMLWRMIAFPSRLRVLWTGLVCVLFVQCVYYDIVFLSAMLSGAAIVVIQRKQWRTLAALIGIGASAGLSILIYLPVIHHGSTYVPMNQDRLFNYSLLWYKIRDTVTAQSSAQTPPFDGPEVWLWVMLLLGGSIVALVMQRKLDRETRNPKAAAANFVRARHDLTLFSFVSVLFGMAGYMAFLVKLQYCTQAWYYVEMLCLCAISLDGLWGATWPAWRPSGLLRIGFMMLVMTWNARSAWEEAHTRRSNVDLIAETLGDSAVPGDLIVVKGAWEGITFDRYYHGQAPWVTVPPIDSHKVHRNDLVMEKIKQLDPMAPVLRQITNTLHNGHSVWIVADKAVKNPKHLPAPPTPQDDGWLPHMYYWSAQIMVLLHDHALQERDVRIPVNGPVSHLENLSATQFSGYKTDTD